MTNAIPKKLVGRYYFAGSSASAEAFLHDESGQLVVTLADGSETYEVTFLRLSDRIGTIPRKIFFEDNSIFETPDNDGVDLAFAKTKHYASWLTRVEGSFKFLAIAVVVTFACLFALYRWGVPAIASVAADYTPTPVVTAIDAGTRDTVDRLLFDESKLSQERKDELTALFNELAAISGQDDPPLRLLFRDGGGLGANAIALPGGTIILTDQLEELIESDDEIAGVFAHEIGHVHERHSLKQIYRILGLTFMISLVGGDSGQIVEEVLGQAVLIETFSYTRSFETSADAYSVKVMKQAGRDPLAFVDLLDRVYKKYGLDPNADTTWLDTHPGNKDRRKDVEALIAQ